MVCGGQEERDGAWQDARLQSNDLPAKWMEDDRTKGVGQQS
jgi:hypothetical protein